MKTLKDIRIIAQEVYAPKGGDEKKFKAKHVVVKHADRNGNKDDVFQATNIKKKARKAERHGYDTGEDEQVYESKKFKLDLTNPNHRRLAQGMLRQATHKANADAAQDDYEHHADQARSYIKSIQSHLDHHQEMTNKKGHNYDAAGTMEHIHKTLRELHRGIADVNAGHMGISASTGTDRLSEPVREETEDRYALDETHALAKLANQVSKKLTQDGNEDDDPGMKKMYHGDAADYKTIAGHFKSRNYKAARQHWSRMDTGARDEIFNHAPKAHHKTLAKHFGVDLINSTDHSDAETSELDEFRNQLSADNKLVFDAYIQEGDQERIADFIELLSKDIH